MTIHPPLTAPHEFGRRLSICGDGMVRREFDLIDWGVRESRVEGFKPTSPDRINVPTPEGAQQVIDVTQEHFGILRELGMKIPEISYTHEPPTPGQYPHDVEAIRIVGITPFIVGSTVNMEEIKPFKLRRAIIGPILAYIEWLDETEQDFILFDLLGKDFGQQYTLTAQGDIVLHDLDPALEDLESDKGQGMMDRLTRRAIEATSLL